jgi:hypothetical protein
MVDTGQKMPGAGSACSPARTRPQEGPHADAARVLEAGLPLSSVVDKLREAVEEGEGWAVMLWLAYYWGRPGQRARGAAMARRGVREATDAELAEVMREAVAAAGDGSAAYGGAHRPSAGEEE